MSLSRTVIGILMSGEELSLKQIAEKASESLGKPIKIQGVSNLLTRVSDKEKCDLAHFIRKNKIRGAFAYKVIHEALALSRDQAYGLYLKTGKDKYTLGEAVQTYPALSKFVNPDDLKRSMPKVEDEAIEEPELEEEPEDEEPEDEEEEETVRPTGSSMVANTSVDLIYEIIREDPDGFDIAGLVQRTKLDDDKICRILLRLSAQGKVARMSKGKYKIT